jgi:hypothetical protein
MPTWIPLYRALLIWSLALWLGGFTFYSAVVIPVLHDQLGSPMETGLVTQRVTDVLNAAGLVTILLGWIGVGLERWTGQDLRTRSRAAILLLAIFSACLVALFVLHAVLDRRLESDSLRGFYALHRAYLWVSVVQWLASLGLLVCWADARGRSRSVGPPQESSSFSGTGTG